MRLHRAAIHLAAIAVFPILSTSAGAITITFDYSKDSGFFNDVNRRTTLNQAASYFTGFSDTLLAITPGGGNTFTATYRNPSTGLMDSTVNLSVPANTLILYAGGRDLPGSAVGEGGPGGFGVSGTQSFVDTVVTRGQSGAAATPASDFGPWGGSISFDTLTNWNFSASPPSPGQTDFLSVAIHELGHALGFGTAPSFARYISGATFTGPTSMSKNNNNAVPLADSGHWANGKTSTLPGTSTVQETAMDPSLTNGTRKLFTVLDYAGMADMGWQVPAANLLTIGPKGDVNGDGFVNAGDINPFVYALSNTQGAFQAQYPSGIYTNADVNGPGFAGDGFINAADINPFVQILGGAGEPAGIAALAALAAVPEPAGASLFLSAAMAATLLTRRRGSR